MTTEIATITIAPYGRVSSDEQKRQETIKNQIEELDRAIKATPGITVFDRYYDDGISGTIPMGQRPAGRRLMEDAARGKFHEVWVWKIDRLGRDDVDPLVVWWELERLGVKVRSITEGYSDPFMYHIHVAVAAEERRTFLARSAAGMERIVKDGHFPGGICPLGYVVEGQKNEARLVPSDRIIWGEWTTVDLIVQIYVWLAIEQWSCPQIADHLNALGVPTAYQHQTPGKRRAERGTGLQAKWRAGRIRNLVVQTVYKGVYQYGKRSKKKDREVLEVEVPRLVSDELWQAAQETLARNKIITKNTPRHYLLTGLIKCVICGKTYCAAHGRGKTIWWRCNGRMTIRYDAEDRCQSKGIKGDIIEPIIWRDIELWLLNPSELIKELEAEQNQDNAAANQEAERTALENTLHKLEQERKGYLCQNAQGLLPDTELREFLKEVAEKKAVIEKRLEEITPQEEEPEPLPADLLEEIRRRLDNGLSEEKRQEIARLLIKRITIRTETENGTGQNIAEVEYRFPDGAVNFRTGIREERNCTLRRVIEIPSGRWLGGKK